MLKVLRIGTVSTNVYLRRLYNFCVECLAAVADRSQEAMANRPFSREAGDHLGRALQNCRAGKESGAQGVLSVGVALGRFPV